MQPEGNGSPHVPQPFRVVVLGNSQAIVVATAQRTPGDGTYGQLLERKLRARGLAAHTIHEARWWELIHKLRPRLLDAVAQNMPNATVLGYGMGECEANVPPTWVMRVLDDARWTPSLNPAVVKIRDSFLPPLNKFRLWTYRKIVPRMGMRTWRLRPDRFEAELDRAVSWIRRQTGGMVIVLTLHDPGEELEKLLPGFRERARMFNDIIYRVVERFDDPDVMTVDGGGQIDRIGRTSATVDGLHYTPAGHAGIAEALYEAISARLDAVAAAPPEARPRRAGRAGKTRADA